ncbi:hypothetical protein [Nonomuraea candida]|uniref:hypothetical protein n=1 Tax=Nonomuraea candida TaxID=359159 RepID=UPI0005B9DB8E|nr:hypothetical protein [Nonomuraea candida]
MPKLKSVIAGLAISTAVTGGLVSAGAATSAANATTTQVTTGTSILGNDGWGWGWGHRRHHHRNRCGKGHHNHGGWGWGWGHRRHHHRGTVCIVIRNYNHNDNGSSHDRRW